MKAAIAMALLFGLVAFVETAQAASEPDGNNCAWGTGSFEQGCDSRELVENAYIEKLATAAGLHRASVKTSNTTDPQSIQTSLKAPTSPSGQN